MGFWQKLKRILTIKGKPLEPTPARVEMAAWGEPRPELKKPIFAQKFPRLHK